MCHLGRKKTRQGEDEKRNSRQGGGKNTLRAVKKAWGPRGLDRTDERDQKEVDRAVRDWANEPFWVRGSRKEQRAGALQKQPREAGYIGRSGPGGFYGAARERVNSGEENLGGCRPLQGSEKGTGCWRLLGQRG